MLPLEMSVLPPVPPEAVPTGFSTTRSDKRGEAFSVRELLSMDRPTLERFYADFEPKRAAQGLPPEGADRVARWLDSVLARGVHLLAEREGQLIGHALVLPTSEAEVGEYAVFLSREQRGRGVGTALNQVALEAARAAGLSRLWLSVEPHNRAAIRSYEKAGFQFRPPTIFSSEPEMEVEL